MLYDFTYVWNKKTNPELVNIENTLVVARGGRGGEWTKWVKGVKRHKNSTSELENVVRKNIVSLSLKSKLFLNLKFLPVLLFLSPSGSEGFHALFLSQG